MLNLFGLQDGDGMAVLRRRYYDFALMCHPDRGGSAEDMVVVQRQYEHAKRELEARDSASDRMQQLEALAQGTVTDDTPVPDMRAIFDEVHGAWQAGGDGAGAADDGEDAWHTMLVDSGNPMEATDGYGEDMVASAYAKKDGVVEPPLGGGQPPVGEPVPETIAHADTATSTAVVHAVEGDCTRGFELLNPADKTTGFGIPTEVPRQLPLTDYAAAHSATAGRFTDAEAAMRAEAHAAVVQADVAERIAELSAYR